MTVSIKKLRDALQNMLDSGVAPETEVRLMTQPRYPMEYQLAGVARRSIIEECEGNYDMRDGEGESEGEAPAPPDDKPEVVYLCEGSHIDYGSRRAWGAIED